MLHVMPCNTFPFSRVQAIWRSCSEHHRNWLQMCHEPGLFSTDMRLCAMSHGCR